MSTVLLGLGIFIMMASNGHAARSIQIERLAFTTERFPDAHDGGTLVIFVRNTGMLPETISGATINGIDINTLVSNSTLRYWRAWPPTIQPGAVGHIQTHGRGTPLNEGLGISVQVSTSAGTSASMADILGTPKLRIGSIIPSRDMTNLYIYIRNLDSVEHVVQKIYVDQDVTSAGQFISGTNIPPNGVGIFRWPAGRVLAKGEPLSILIHSLRAGITENWSAAWYRVIEPLFMIGSYMSYVGQAASQSQPIERFFREMQGNMATTTLYWPEVANVFTRYGIHSYAFTGEPPDINFANQAASNPAVYAWMLKDEPDVGGIPASTINTWNKLYWDANSPRATVTTLADNNRFAEYNNICDIAMMDHYAHYAPLTGSAGLSNTLLFTRQLKWRTEPRLQWTYAQLAATSGWSRQPDPWSVNTQFWSHVLAGAKGIKWFFYDGLNSPSVGMETSAAYQAPIYEGRNCGQTVAQIRELCLYSESIDSVQVNNLTGKIGTAALVGPDTLVVIAVNLNDSRPLFSNWQLAASSGELTFEVPAWIPIDAVKELTRDTLTNAIHNRSGRQVTIPVTLNSGASSEGWSRVYIIGRNDSAKPQVPTRLNVAQALSGSSFILAWHDAQDNYGVKGYKVYRNNVLVADTRAPWVQINEASSNFSRYRVAAYDAWGNSSDDPAPTPTATPTAPPSPAEVKPDVWKAY